MRVIDAFKNLKNSLSGAANALNEGWKEGQERNKKRVKQNEIEIVNIYIQKIESLLEFQAYKKLSDALKDAFTAWLNILEIKADNEKAEIVLSALLQNDKIWDSLSNALEFAETLEPDEDVKTISEIFINQFIYFLRKSVNAMRDKYLAVPEKIINKTDQKLNVLRFINEECFAAPSISGVPSAYEALKRLKLSLRVGEDKTLQQMQDFNNVSTCFELLEQAGPEYNSDIAELTLIKSGLLDRFERMNANIDKAKPVYDIIINFMSDKWFDDFYPDIEGAEVSKIISIDELKKFYCERLSAVSDKLKDFIN